MKSSSAPQVWFWTLVIFVIVSSAAIADIDSGLVAYYNFEDLAGVLGETIVDRSGNGHDGVCRQNQSTLKVPTIVSGPTDQGDALSFDGDFYVEIPNHADFDITDHITMSLWITVDLFDIGWQSAFTRGDWSWRMARNGDSNFSMDMSAAAGNNMGEWGPVTTSSVADGAWYHVVAVWPGTGQPASIYVNGAHEYDTIPLNGSINTVGNDPVVIGGQIHLGVLRRQWKGSIDEVRIYDRALDSTEVQDLYEYNLSQYNEKPQVNAGSDEVLMLPNDTITLDGAVSDDGIGDPNGYLFVKWNYVSGPGEVTWEPNEYVEDPTVTFSYDPGVYVFELYASDGDKNAADTVAIVLNESILGDLDGNNIVNILDLQIFCSEWPDSPGNLANLNNDDSVDMLDFGLFSFNWMKRGPSLVINEFLASNSSTLPQDPQGHFEDWIELYNPTDTAINVGGMYLTDNLNVPQKWPFPTDRPAETIVQPHDFLVVWADKHTEDSPGLHANFQLDADNGEEIGLYDSDGILLDSIVFGGQDTDVSYGRDPDASEIWYTLTPTAETSNTGQSLDIVEDTKFSVDRGFYDAPIQVAITSATVGATIFYTTNFEEPEDTPSSTNIEYTGPITIDKTTCLRARAFKPGWKPTNIDTQTYIFLDDVVRQDANPPGFPSDWNGHTAEYGMDPDVIGNFDSNGNSTGGDLFGGVYAATIKDDLKAIPTMSLVMEMGDVFGNSGIYANPNGSGIGWERPGSVELIYPDPVKAPDDGFQVNCGVRIYGGVGRNTSFEKKTFRFLFKGIYGPTKLRYDLFGRGATDKFDTIIVRAGFNNSWHRHNTQEEKNTQLTRHEWANRAQLAMGHPGLHGTFVHLYVNGLYWGLYDPVERCTADFGASYFGGDKEEYDALNSYPRKIVDGNANAWIAAQNLADAGVADAAGYEAIRQYIDVDNLIDYMLLNFYAGNLDWDDHNWYAVRHRVAGAGWKHICWDSERILENPYENNHGGTASGGVPIPNMDIYNKASHMFQALRQNPEFRTSFGDHVHKHFFNNGTLMPANAAAIFQELSTFIDRAIVGESARWGDSSRSLPYTRDAEWVTERDRLLTEYFPVRTDHTLNILKNAGLYPTIDAPVFNINGFHQHGGYVNSGDLLSMDNPNGSGVIYYTLDGTDPRLPTTVQSTAEQLVAESAAKKVHVPTVQLAGDWTGGQEPFDDSGWDEIDAEMALDFDSTDGTVDSVDVGAKASDFGVNGNNPKAVTAWVYTRSFNNGGVFSMGDYANNQDFSLRTLGANDNWRVQFWGSAGDIDFAYPSLNTWVHFALVHDGTNTTVYADGIPQATEPRTLATSDVIGFKIGVWRTDYFDGVIDDVQLYDQVLDQMDVQSIMSQGTCSKTPVSRWELDGGDKAYDSAGSHDGTLVGNPTWVRSDLAAGLFGVGYENNPGDTVNYTDLIAHDVQAQMSGTMASCYIRIPFTLNTNPSELNYITLKARYDDGFVAYINGEELTRDNFNAAVPGWNAEADGLHDDTLARQLLSFKVARTENPDVFDALQLGDNILAIHGMNYGIGSSDFLISAELYAGDEAPIGEIISPAAVAYSDPNSLTGTVQVKARVLSDDSQWSALNEAVYLVGPVAESLRITEIMYHPTDATQAEKDAAGDPNLVDEDFEFIELKNIGTAAINLNLVHFTDGIDFTFGDYWLGAEQF
ncbi:MAG: lamin tail domain-containing protein, partial [Planctomycetes bacterium]|nr:lamin tail domain-containing protein [Planctomycetota bacterium]